MEDVCLFLGKQTLKNLSVKRRFIAVTNCVNPCIGAQTHLPKLSFFVERVSYGHLDHFQLVAWRLTLDSGLRRQSKKQTMHDEC